MKNYHTSGEGDVIIGNKTSFGKGVEFIFKKAGKITIGDYVTIGDGVKIVLEDGAVSIDDWSTVHSNTLILCKKGVQIGQHCWFGQHCILDGTGGLAIENGVRVGMYSQIWSHIAAGEQIEGCTFFSASPVHICADVWLVGSCTVGSGVKIGRRAVCLSGSNVTKSVGENTIVAGVPAKIKEGAVAYINKSLDEKFEMMRAWVVDFCRESAGVFQLGDIRSDHLCISSTDGQVLKMFKYSKDYESCRSSNAQAFGQSLFCIENKKYNKIFIDIEEKLMRYLAGNKARFYRD